MKTPVMTVAQAAKLLGMSEWMVRYYAAKGELPHLPIGNVYIFQRADVLRFRQARDQPGVVDVAEMLGVAPATVRGWVAEGLLSSEKIAGKRKFHRTDVEAFARDRGLIIRQPVEGERDE